MADETPPAAPPAVIIPPPPPGVVSPNGVPVLPPTVARWAAPICFVAGLIVMEGPEIGLVLPLMVLPWIKLVWILGTSLGIVSSGARVGK